RTSTPLPSTTPPSTATTTPVPSSTSTSTPPNTATSTQTPTSTSPPAATSTAIPSATATATPTPAGPMMAHNDYTDDGANPKTVFQRGDPVRYIGMVDNQAGYPATGSFRWTVDGPAGNVEDLTAPVLTSSGMQAWGIVRTIPAQAPFGTYTFTFAV